VRERLSYGYEMLVKVGFFYYWLGSCLISVVLYQLIKAILYWLISDLFMSQSIPPQNLVSALVLFLLVFSFTIALIIMHIR
jgi:hypothetical protein